jgi:NADPH:quinone reductase-like Zn-dependent oxidoreductase
MEPAWKQVSEWISQGKVTPQIGLVLPLERSIEAYKLLEQGKNYGKIVVTISA